MRKIWIKRFVAGLLLAVPLAVQGFAQGHEDGESVRLKAQTAGLTDREALARAEERAEALRTKLFAVQMQEMSFQAILDDLDYRLSPEGIRAALAFVGSVRPMDEWRYELRIKLEGQRAGVSRLAQLVTASRERLEAAISEAESEIERLRQRLSVT